MPNPPFDLVPDWADGRHERDAISIAQGNRNVFANAVSLEGTPRTGKLHFSVADPSAFLGDYKLDRFMIADDLPASPTILRMRELLRLRPDSFRPVITASFALNTNPFEQTPLLAQESLKAETMSFVDAAKRINNINDSIHVLDMVAQAIFEQNVSRGAMNSINKVTEQTRASEIVRSPVMLLNTTIATFMKDNNIPAMYYTRDKNSGARTETYTTSYEDYDPAEKIIFARVSSPLMRIPDFINIINIAQFLKGKPPQYGTEQLDRFSIILNKNRQNKQKQSLFRQYKQKR